MNAWLLCGFILCLALAPCGYLVMCKSDPVERLVGLEAAGILEAIILMLLSQSFSRSNFYDVALAMAVLSAGGGLVFVRFLERWE